MARIIRTPGDGANILSSALAALHNKQLKVGFVDSSKYEDGTPVAYVATIQEFGHPAGKIPPRPFMRPTVTRDEPKWKSLATSGARAILRGSASTNTVMQSIGAVAAGGVKRSISEVTSPPLSPLTLRLRKLKRQGATITGRTVGQAASDQSEISGVSTKPLVFDGIMLNAVTYAVEDIS